MIPGEYFIKEGTITCNASFKAIRIKATNTGDRPIQIGSHFHFFEVNKSMSFDREKTFGMRLNIPSGTAARFEPGEEKTVELVSYGGLRRVFGNNNLINGDTSSEFNKQQSLVALKSKNFKNK